MMRVMSAIIPMLRTQTATTGEYCPKKISDIFSETKRASNMDGLLQNLTFTFMSLDTVAHNEDLIILTQPLNYSN